MWGALTVHDHTGSAPAHSACAFPVYTAQTPACSAGEVSKAGPGFHALRRSKSFKFRFVGTPQGRRLSWVCVLCPCQVRAARDQLPGECTVPGGPCILITSPVPAALFPGCAGWALFQMCYVSPLGGWSQAATLLAGVNRPGSQEDLVSNWEPVHSLVEDASLCGWDCSSPLPSGCRSPASQPPAGVGGGVRGE